jgi:hypothetical protein
MAADSRAATTSAMSDMDGPKLGNWKMVILERPAFA